MLKKFLQQDDLTTKDPDSVLFTSLLPLMYMNSLHVRARCCSVRRQYLRSQRARKPHLGHTYNKLEEARYRLRRSIEDAKDGLEQLTTYLCVSGLEDRPQELCYLGATKEHTKAQQEAIRPELEIPDHLQLQVGNLTLQESKKSIELSNYQIQEGKRGK